MAMCKKEQEKSEITIAITKVSYFIYS